jgi:predicted RNase H-like nuclease
VKSILAIDPAWTIRGPSGVALLRRTDDRWSCIGLAPSYAQFVALADGRPVDWSSSPKGGAPSAGELLHAARLLLNETSVDLVTIDMPVASTLITGRRACDAAISQKFGGQGCSTHSPSTSRPGEISDKLRAKFADLGYPLATTETPQGRTPALVEVYPHPALLVLLDAQYRMPYKISRSGRYWPGDSPAERRRRILQIWQKIYTALNGTISGSELTLPSLDMVGQLSNRLLKPYEDALDALICGWVGIQYLEGRCYAYGDGTAAIWTP